MAIDETTIITGGARGLGATIAQRLLRAQKVVHLIDTFLPADNRLPGAIYHQVDVSQRESVSELMNSIGSSYRITGLVNNVGIRGEVGPVDEVSSEGWWNGFSVNTLGAVWCIQSVLPFMKENRRGSVVTISTNSVRNKPLNRSVYIASKAALEEITLSLAREVAPWGIRCNVIRPGMMDNERLRGVLQAAADKVGKSYDAVLETELSYVSNKRLVQMDEVAAMAEVMLGNDVCAMTGQIVEVDGYQLYEN